MNKLYHQRQREHTGTNIYEEMMILTSASDSQYSHDGNCNIGLGRTFGEAFVREDASKDCYKTTTTKKDVPLTIEDIRN